jgi:hypothetical protein
MPLSPAAPLRTTDTWASEPELLDDPSHDYARMDAASQALYHEAVDEMAARVRCDPRIVAATAVRLARAQCAVTTPGDATRHVGYFLVAEGRDALHASLTHAPPPAASPTPRETRTVAAFSATIVIVGLLLGTVALQYFHLREFSPVVAVLVALLLLLHAVGRTAILANLLAALARPRRLPRLDFSAGIPANCLTAVCVPTLVTNRGHVTDMVATVERHWQAIRDDNIRIVLLTDWPDADRQDPTPEEAALLDELAAQIDRLNASYGRDGSPRFYLLHRARRYSITERCWMGWERKRGKLLQFNRLVAEGAHDFARTVGNLAELRRVIYAVVVDDDTVLAPGAIQTLVGTIAHPVARLQRVASRRGALRGFGAMIPNVGPRAKTDAQGRALVPREWPRKVDFDLFGECGFQGQGLYDIRWAHRQLERRFPEGCVLSHDVVESGFLRCGFSERALFIERGPQNERLFNERWHRWMRGDCQNVWVMFRLRQDGVEGGRRYVDGRLRLIQWYWVVMSVIQMLPRLTLGGLLAVVVCGDPALAGRRFSIVLGLNLLPDFVGSAFRTYQSTRREGRRAPSVSTIAMEIVNIVYIALARVASALYGAFMSADAIVSVIVRIMRRRRLLAWVSSSHLARSGIPFYRLDTYSYLAPVIALAGVVWLWMAGRRSPGGLGVLLLTVLWPVAVWAWNRTRKKPAAT